MKRKDGHVGRELHGERWGDEERLKNRAEAALLLDGCDGLFEGKRHSPIEEGGDDVEWVGRSGEGAIFGRRQVVERLLNVGTMGVGLGEGGSFRELDGEDGIGRRVVRDGSAGGRGGGDLPNFMRWGEKLKAGDLDGVHCVGSRIEVRATVGERTAVGEMDLHVKFLVGGGGAEGGRKASKENGDVRGTRIRDNKAAH